MSIKRGHTKRHYRDTALALTAMLWGLLLKMFSHWGAEDLPLREIHPKMLVTGEFICTRAVRFSMDQVERVISPGWETISYRWDAGLFRKWVL